MNSAKPKRRGGPSGVNQLTDVKLRADDDEIALWEMAAGRLGVDRNTFLRRAANELAEATAAADIEAMSGGRATVRGGKISRSRV